MNGSTPQLEDLVRALSKRQLLVVVGSLVREAAGLLGPNGLVAKGLEGGVFSDAARVDVRVLAAKGEHAAALELIKTRLGPDFSRVYEPLLAGDRPAPPASLRALALLAGSLPRVLTTNLDNLVELALPGRWAPLAEATADLASRTEVVFKMLGDARHFTTWRFTQDGLKNATYLAPHFRTEVGALLRGHQLLFIGYRGDDELLEELLRLRAHAPKDLNMPQWVALVPPGGLEKREHYGKVGLQLVVLDVPADDPVAYDGAVAEYLKELARAGPGTTIDPGALPERMLTGNPYPGLIPFSEAQAGQFFGREDECRTLVGKLGTSPMGHVRWLMLTGPSGVGKSSLLAAGLVPAVRAATPPVAGAPTQWCVALLRPGRELLRNLAAGVREALAHDLGQPVAPRDLGREHLLATDRALTDFLAPRLQGRGLLLVLDQFEEAFTVGAADERPYLDALLVRGLQDLEVPFYVVTAMRSDCVGDFARHFPRLTEQLNRGTLSARHDLPPLRAHGLHEAVVRPAELAGRVFEAGLVDRILRDAGAVQYGGDEEKDKDKDAPDATLPLVAHVLHALVEREPGRVLSLRAYEALGGVARALTKSADTLLASLQGEYTDAQVRGLLVELVELHPQGRDTRRVLPRAAALAAAGGDAKAEALLLRLSGSTPGHAQDTLPVRLVTVHSEGEHAVVDLVHDALLREWATLRGWLGEDRETQLLRRELARATATWLHQQRSIDELWRGGRLARASETLTSIKLSAEEQIFLTASAAQEHAEAAARDAEQADKLRVARRTNRRLFGLGAVFLAASILAFVEYRLADVARADATRAADLAEDRLATANTVVNRILFDALPELDRVSGTVEVKKKIHAHLEDLQAKLLPDAESDVQALRNRMVQHSLRGDLALTHDNLDLARQEFELGFKIAKELAERVPSNADAHRNLAAALLKLGEVELNAGNVADARIFLERALSIFERMVVDNPQKSTLRRDLAETLGRLGDLEGTAGNDAASRVYFNRALSICEELAADFPENTNFRHALSSALHNLGRTEHTAGNLAEARLLFERALPIDEQLAADDPENAAMRRSLCLTLNSLGDVESDSGNFTSARIFFERSLSIIEKMVEDDSQNAALRRDLSYSLNCLGELERTAGNLAAARLLLERALSVDEKLVADDSQNATLRRDLAFSLDSVGEIEETAGNLDASRRLFERSFAIRERLVQSAPDNADFRHDLSVSLKKLGDIEKAAGDIPPPPATSSSATSPSAKK